MDQEDNEMKYAIALAVALLAVLVAVSELQLYMGGQR